MPVGGSREDILLLNVIRADCVPRQLSSSEICSVRLLFGSSHSSDPGTEFQDQLLRFTRAELNDLPTDPF